MKYAALAILLSACCPPVHGHDDEKAKRDMEELERKVAASRSSADAERSARAARPEEPPPFKGSDSQEIEAMNKARLADHKAAVAARKVFAEKVKRSAQCQTAILEGDASDTLHTTGCVNFAPPLTDSGTFDEAKQLGFSRIHNHVGKAMCSYYLQNYPSQKVWKCDVKKWPEP